MSPELYMAMLLVILVMWMNFCIVAVLSTIAEHAKRVHPAPDERGYPS